MEKAVLQVQGMSCGHCEKAVKDALIGIGVKTVKASAKNNTVEVGFAAENITLEVIKNEIRELGYHV